MPKPFSIARVACVALGQALCVTALVACSGPIDTDSEPLRMAVTPMQRARAQSAPPPVAQDLQVRAFTIDGFARNRLSDLSAMATLIDAAVGANANTIGITFNLVFDPQGNSLTEAPLDATDLVTRPEDIIPVIRLARSKGARVFLKPQTTIYDRAALTAVGNVADYWTRRYPNFNVSSFFRGYSAGVLRFAEVAQGEGVSIYSVGTENDGLHGTQYEANWRQLIAGVRQRFSGVVTYGASVRFVQQGTAISDFRTVAFWDALDWIGLSLYPGWVDLPGKFADHEPMALFQRVRWDFYSPAVDTASLLQPVLARYGKKLFIEEFGFQALPNQLQNFYDVSFYTAPSQWIPPPDYVNQANAYDAYFKYFLTAFQGQMVGFNAWDLNALALTAGRPEAWRVSQWLVMREADGSLFYKPALQTIGDFYGERRYADLLVHRIMDGATSVR